jgi:hypothetical protein
MIRGEPGLEREDAVSGEPLDWWLVRFDIDIDIDIDIDGMLARVARQ